jgi:hypothetical protein
VGLNEGMLHGSRGKLAVGTVTLDGLGPYPQALRRVSAAGHASHITRHTSRVTCTHVSYLSAGIDCRAHSEAVAAVEQDAVHVERVREGGEGGG